MTVALIDLEGLVGEERKYGQLTVESATEIALAGLPGDCSARDVCCEYEGAFTEYEHPYSATRVVVELRGDSEHALPAIGGGQVRHGLDELVAQCLEPVLGRGSVSRGHHPSPS